MVLGGIFCDYLLMCIHSCVLFPPDQGQIPTPGPGPGPRRLTKLSGPTHRAWEVELTQKLLGEHAGTPGEQYIETTPRTSTVIRIEETGTGVLRHEGIPTGWATVTRDESHLKVTGSHHIETHTEIRTEVKIAVSHTTEGSGTRTGQGHRMVTGILEGQGHHTTGQGRQIRDRKTTGHSLIIEVL